MDAEQESKCVICGIPAGHDEHGQWLTLVDQYLCRNHYDAECHKLEVMGEAARRLLQADKEHNDKA